jgi:arsenite-transporting ATPase
MALNGLHDSDLKLILFGGKGGVGKTSCAIATAIELSQNFKTLLISTDPAHSISDSLGQSIGFKPMPVNGVANLTAIEIEADEAFSTFKTDHESQLKKLFDTSTSLDQEDIDQIMTLSIPGIDEVMSFKIIIDFLEEGNFDKYIVDTAPTGHALRLITSPKLLDEWIKMAARMRWKYRYMITSFSGSYQQDEVDTLLLELKKTVKRIENLLRDNTKSEFIPVCIPELMAINETRRLLADLGKFQIATRQIVINNVMASDEGDFCRRKMADQQKYLQEINDTFPEHNKVATPMFPEEIRGLDALNHFNEYLFSNKINKV